MITDRAELEQNLARKEVPELAGIAEAAAGDAQILGVLLDGLVAKDDTLRYHSFLAVMQVCEDAPEVLYPAWDRFVQLLDSPNAYHRSIAVRLLACLSRVDTEGRLDRILEPYFARLDDDKVMVARYLVQSAGKIVQAKPYLQEEVTVRLLAVEDTHHPPRRKDLIKADIVELFDHAYDTAQDPAAIRSFVEQQKASSSPSARKSAARFLQAHRL